VFPFRAWGSSSLGSKQIFPPGCLAFVVAGLIALILCGVGPSLATVHLVLSEKDRQLDDVMLFASGAPVGKPHSLVRLVPLFTPPPHL